MEWPIVKLFGRLGPAARVVLPVLKPLQVEEESRSLVAVEQPPSEALTPAAWAIYQITGDKTV